ncbi:hydroxyisourate hydrolase [Nonomuraea endophytica]|uniref:5-hydroxyisourate hydrolase n=1 Tax=Nonomuraea endophytica TaxID=714136 RepID=A0A7W8EDV1_9ACTN|nr:hydroxyisourate hydrolase [Nonomuraea endophytica]MBB5076945.1 5-hydroxyisourate hydrolase [Nonomuraea endophytica]
MSFSTHILNAATGRPAAGVPVRLERDGEVVAEGRTDDDGRIKGWNPGRGVHRVVFDTGALTSFYPEVVITFAVDDPDQHYHVPLLLSPFAYSTYRGS